MFLVKDTKFEGDIELTSHHHVDQREDGDVDGPITGEQSKRGAVARERRRLWKNKIVPYEITVRMYFYVS